MQVERNKTPRGGERKRKIYWGGADEVGIFTIPQFIQSYTISTVSRSDFDALSNESTLMVVASIFIEKRYVKKDTVSLSKFFLTSLLLSRDHWDQPP